MPWADMITDQPGACMGSQVWKRCDVTRLYAKRKLKVKYNTSMHRAITLAFTQYVSSCVNLHEQHHLTSAHGVGAIKGLS